ncbi:L-lactate dehydrogenase [Diplogelasinospora grovesii]|uniref:L-lactate dehydrogenase n=1 Tax=Diplogelasinospora grovesii TaxID=303347 RepID=A0AAN6S0T8_9PEZI|nr:L-lactate dehydrogenase [Diplogelasinospora grovesii]
MPRTVSTSELSSHNNENSAWLAVNGTVWDVSGFAAAHPGGREVIEEYFGRDASSVYNEFHGPGLIAKQLGESKRIGNLEPVSVPAVPAEPESAPAPSTTNVQPPPEAQEGKPTLESIVNLHDFEAAGKHTLSGRALAYVPGYTCDGVTFAGNQDFYRRIYLRPRVLRNVSTCDMSRSIFGRRFNLPFFSAPAASIKLIHPDGECALAAGTSAAGGSMVVPTLSSFTIDEIVDSLPKGHPFFFQLYFWQDRTLARKLLEDVARLKPVAIMVTVDLPVFSKRESYERYELKMAAAAQRKRTGKMTREGQEKARESGNGRAIASDLTWDELKWIKEVTGGIPVVVKGIQSAADAKKALEYGCDGIYISNHGGRAVDSAYPTILTLLEIQAQCPEVLGKMEVFIDGGIRRGTDVLKAICLGASGVCVGRPMFYAAGFGVKGVQKAVKILADELQSAMQLCGITSLDQAHPGLLNTTELDPYVYRTEEHPWAKKIVRQGKL